MTTPGNPESGPTQVPDQVPAAAQTRGPRERSSSADEPAIELVDDEKNRETRRVKDVIKDAKATVVKMFRGKRIKLKTNRGEIAMDTMEYILTFPFLHMEEQWIEDIEAIPAGDRKAEALSELRVEYGHYKPNKTGLGRVHETVMMTEAYLEKMSHEEGWITPEVLAEMINSLSAKASIFADLLAKKGNTDVLEALKWSLNIADDMVEGETQAIETLQKRLPKEFTEKGECMDALWMTLSFSNKDKRIEIAKHFAKEDPGQLSAFLKEGNRRGVYSPDEMKGLGMTFSEDENAQYASNFKEARNFTANAQQMLSRSYGTVNAAAEMMTGENLLTFIGYVAAGTTVIANLGVGAFTMYRDQDFSPDRIVKTVVSKNVIGGALAWKGLDLLRSGGKAGQILAGKEKRDTLAERQAIQTLSDETRGNTLWEKWDGFFKSDEHAGSKAFFDFMNANKTKKGDFPKEKFTAENFKEYLKAQAALAAAGKPTQSQLKYDELLRVFDSELKNSDSKSILSLAKVFDHFKIGGAEAESHYANAMAKVANV